MRVIVAIIKAGDAESSSRVGGSRWRADDLNLGAGRTSTLSGEVLNCSAVTLVIRTGADKVSTVALAAASSTSFAFLAFWAFAAAAKDESVASS